MTAELPPDIADAVRLALDEDVGTGDLTAELIPLDRIAEATVVCREHAVLCGRAWFDETFRQLDDDIVVRWNFNDGSTLAPDSAVCSLKGRARNLVTGERTALNFLQTLSATATAAQTYANRLTGTSTKLLDTRKTIPGLRSAQKYAVACGGGTNHRVGLHDGILIKENHIEAAGSISKAISALRMKFPGVAIECEVENFNELDEALNAGADILLLDNFTIAMLEQAVARTAGAAKLEASGGFELEALAAVGKTGVDYVSVGALTKHIQAIDYSMRFSASR